MSLLTQSRCLPTCFSFRWQRGRIGFRHVRSSRHDRFLLLVIVVGLLPVGKRALLGLEIPVGRVERIVDPIVGLTRLFLVDRSLSVINGCLGCGDLHDLRYIRLA